MLATRQLPQKALQATSCTDDVISNRSKQDADVALLSHKVDEPSLGTADKLSTRRESTSTNRVPSAKRLHGHLTSLRSRPKTQTFSTYSGLTGQSDYVQEDIFAVQYDRSSSPLSHKSTNVSASVPWTFHSTSRMKQLPLPLHSHTTTPFPRVGSARGVRSVPVCTERYLGTDINSKSHIRSKSMENIQSPRSFTAQVKRFDGERKALYRTRTRKRVTEVYSHRLDQGYYMSGSGVGLADKYHVDEAELERLREFSRSKMAFRTGSASSLRLRSRPSLTTPTSGFFVTQKDMASDAASEMVISGRQFSSAVPSEGGKTIHTRSSSAVTVITHEAGAKTGTDGEQNETIGDDSADVGQEEKQSVQVDGNNEDSTNTNGQDVDGIISNSSTNQEDAGNSNTNQGDDGDNNSYKSSNGENDDAKFNPNHDNSHGDKSNSDQDSILPATNEDVGNQLGASNDGDASHHSDAGNHGGGGTAGNAADFADILKQEDKCGHHGGSEDGQQGGGHVAGCVQGDRDAGGGDDGGPNIGGSGDKTENQDGQDTTKAAEETQPSSPGGEVLQINLTAGITLISKPSVIRNKDEVFMTNFDDPSMDGLRSEMEIIQKNKDIGNDEDDDDDETGDDNRGNLATDVDAADDARRYKLNTKDSEISRMEEKLEKTMLGADIASVGHLSESRKDLRELELEEEAALKVAETMASGEYNAGVFAQTKNDEELQEANERRKERQEQQHRLRKPYTPTTQKSNEENKMELKKPYKFQLSDIYKFINSRQQAIFEEKFEELDTNKNGKVTLKEVKKKLKGTNAPKAQILKFMQVFDLNKDKTIDKREFVTVAALNDKLTGYETQSVNEPLRLDLDTLSFNIQAYKEMFQVTDRNGDGRLNLEEIMLIVALSVGIDIGSDPEVVKHVHQTIDADNDGSIDFIEFLSYIPFFLKLYHQIVGRPATIQEIEDARLAVRKAVLKVDVL